jgi:serine/threonine-protein kinase
MPDQQRIGKYDLVAKIGEGAMGEVFKAHDPILNRFVAVKTMSGLLTTDEDLVQRFRREAQSAARLNHPNIVTIFDFAEDQGKFYMAMELLEGEDLKDVIARNGLNDLWDKIEIMEQICDGLAFAHSQGVVHRDLKPANIRILPNGRVKIMDFGLARLGTSDMTRAGMVMGTPNYMSPEQVRGQKADQRSDIFSLGAVFYELLSGHKAFHAPSMHSVLFKVLEQQHDPVRNWVPGLPLPFVQLVDKALDKAPERRYQDAAELRAAVRSVRDALALDGEEGGLDPSDPASATLYSVGEDTMVEAATAPRLRGSVTGANALALSQTPVPRTAVR